MLRCCIYLCRGTGLRQLQQLLHRSHARHALSHSASLQQLRGVRTLTERERLLPLSHLDAEVVEECAEIAHSKTSRHLVLEAVDVLRARAGDDQVIHIHANNELLLPSPPRVEHMLGCASLEPKLAQHGVKLGVPCLWGLP